MQVMRVMFKSSRRVFEELTRPFGQDLMRLALYRLKHTDDAEDAVQDTYLRAYRSFHTFKQGTNIKAWMVKILFNVISDSINKRSKQPDSIAEEEIESVESNSASLKDPQLQIVENELNSELLAALAGLPSNLLNPLLLRELEDMTYEQISQTLEVPVGTVMSRLFRARKVLRERLSGGNSAQKTQESSQGGRI